MILNEVPLDHTTEMEEAKSNIRVYSKSIQRRITFTLAEDGDFGPSVFRYVHMYLSSLAVVLRLRPDFA